MKTFAIYAARALTVYLGATTLLLTAVAVWLLWRGICRIATRRQPQPETGPSTAVLDAQTLANVDAELDRRLDQLDLHAREEGRP
jgi:hypothetical protein